MPVRATFQLKGLDAYLEDLSAAGQNVDLVAAELLSEVAPYAENELRRNLLNTKQAGETWTGETEGNIEVSDVQQDGNFSFFELSIKPTSDAQEIKKEFGTARQPAEPFFRITLRGHLLKNKVKAVMKQLLQKYGVSA